MAKQPTARLFQVACLGLKKNDNNRMQGKSSFSKSTDARPKISSSMPEEDKARKRPYENAMKSSSKAIGNSNKQLTGEIKIPCELRGEHVRSVNKISEKRLNTSKINPQTQDLCTNVDNIKCIPSESISTSNLYCLEPEPDCAIPPPVPKSYCGDSSDACKTLVNNGNSSTDDSGTNDSKTSPFMEPDSKQLKRISDFIHQIVKEKYVPSSQAVQVVRDLNNLFRDQLEGNNLDIYGSYDSDVAVSTSDINLVLNSDVTVRKGFMYEVYKVLYSEQDKYHVLPYEDRDSATQAKIQFFDALSGCSCQLVYLGKKEPKYKKMGMLLKSVCNHDKRIKTLIIAVKIWAEICLINEVEEGKLHPVGYIMMMLHFLQHYEKPLLPIPIEFYQNMKIESSLPSTESSVGELWLGFLRYYLSFNWAQNVVTINSKDPVSKKSKGWENVWMVIEDPYTGKNIASSVVNSDVAESIKLCFKTSYEYFCSPPEESNSSDSMEEIPKGNDDFSSEQLQFSFQQCVVDSSIHFCEACDELDDVCSDCKRKIYISPMASVPAMNCEFLSKIRDVLNSVSEKYMLTEAEVQERKDFVCNLQNELHKIYPDIKLHLFGSSANGFGFKNSDLDICMTFENYKVKNTSAVLQHLRSHLRKNKDYDHLIAIFSAKIPILRFRYLPKGWRGDICVNNSLAVYNSRLIHAYSQLDKRCKILGCALKLLAKKALIAEVTEKTLSSYSYLIMVIHFLQQTDPPILPVLQDQKFNKHGLQIIMDRCNVWYYTGKNIEASKNDTSVEQLWLDMLDYYCTYDSNKFITIRQKETLFLNEEEQVSAPLFNIQDPFIEVKNLGKVVSAKKAQEIQSVFIRARYLFRNPVKDFPSFVDDLESYFFATMSLTGRIHKEAHCDMCGQYGHETKDCKHNLNRNFPFQRYKLAFQKRLHGWKSAEKQIVK